MTRRTWMLAAAAVLFVSPAHAQKDDFIDAFVALASALPATYGDEGAQVSAAFARMAAALETWDRTAAAAEADLKKRSATPGEFALHYVEHQRIELALNAMRFEQAQKQAADGFFKQR